MRDVIAKRTCVRWHPVGWLLLLALAGCAAPPLTQAERDHYVSPSPRPYCLDDSAAPCLSQGLW